mmetsp:Transcript_21809/g.68334  ORF Transcript_21809/g.68334 Transcript_21809/m.68334 type:complete len:308 (-) Transcript_21809:500-1423(-)
MGKVAAVEAAVARPERVRETWSSASSCMYKMESTETTAVPKATASTRTRRSGADWRTAAVPREMARSTDLGPFDLARFAGAGAAATSATSWGSGESLWWSVRHQDRAEHQALRCFFSSEDSSSRSTSPGFPPVDRKRRFTCDEPARAVLVERSSGSAVGTLARCSPWGGEAQAGSTRARRKTSKHNDIRCETPKRPISRPSRSMMAPTARLPRPQLAEPQKRCRPQASPPSRASARTIASATGDAADDADRATRRAATRQYKCVGSASLIAAWCDRSLLEDESPSHDHSHHPGMCQLCPASNGSWSA